MSNKYEKIKQEVVNILRNEMGQTAELVYRDRGGNGSGSQNNWRTSNGIKRWSRRID